MSEIHDFHQKIVESEKDIVGHIAYSIHIQRKNELDGSQTPNFDALVNISDLKKRAQELIDEAFEKINTTKLTQVKNELAEGLLINRMENIQKDIKLFPWLKSISASAVAAVVVPAILLGLLFLFEGKAKAILKILAE